MSLYTSLSIRRLSNFLLVACSAICYTSSLIRSFKTKALKRFIETGKARGINPSHLKDLRLLLAQMRKAREIKDLNLPGRNLHQLKGGRKGEWSLKVRDGHRLTFRFDGDVYDLSYEDYH